MRRLLSLCVLASACALGAAPFTESDFRATLAAGEQVQLSYRGPDCKALTFEQFAEVMSEQSVRSDVERAVDGKSITVTARRRGGNICPSAYPPIGEMPAFELRDLAGVKVTSAGLRGKPTLVNFYFAQCVPCILEVGPINRFAAERPDLNFLAVTFDEPAVARAFVNRYKFRWRVVPDARVFIDQVGVKQYPTMALFDARGRLLGTRLGGVRDELEAATVAPQLARWVDGLLRQKRD